MTLGGRSNECAVLERLVASARAGESQVLVLHGEAGVGKTALLGHVAEAASGCRIARASGVESEMEFAFAGLHQLCGPMLGRLGHLPKPQADALGIAFGLREGATPNRFLVALAVLSLLSDADEERPLICIVDDAQWLDRASLQAISFVARRLAAEPIAIFFAVRDPRAEQDLLGLPEMLVRGLSDGEARKLLDSVVSGPLDQRVIDRIIAETQGNPLALTELPRDLTPMQLAGGFGLPAATPLDHRVQEAFRRRLDTLPEETRLLLLVAAAEPVGDPVTVWRAAESLGIEAAAAGPATAADLVEFGVAVRFRHPLVRSAVYQAASPEARQLAHRALAEATDERIDPDRRAWHRAQATSSLDEEVAAELERSAGRARARGGLAATAAFLHKAVELSPEPESRARRALAAAMTEHEAGAPEAALDLLVVAQAGPLDALQQARAELLRAQITFAVTRGRDAPPMLLAAAKRLEPLDPALAKETYLDAFSAALFADRLAREGDVHEVAEAVLAADWDTQPRPGQETSRSGPRAGTLLLEGMAILTTVGNTAGAPLIRRALDAFRTEPMSDEHALRWGWLACRMARGLGDDVAWEELTRRQVRLARDAGALSLLPIALTERFGLKLLAGDLPAAEALMVETAAVVEASGSHLAPQGAIALAAWRGREKEALELIEASRRDVLRRGEGLWLIAVEWASAVLFNGLGRYEEALAAAEEAIEHPYELGLSTWVPTELIEAAVRSGHTERAGDALRRLQKISHASGTDWALGVEARSRALLSRGDEAERLYRRAISLLSRTSIRVALARAHLLYGEWLRREGRRIDAREQLRFAHEAYSEMGMEAFADRALRELAATGEKVRKRSVETVPDLTAQELQIARLAVSGRTNPEIAAQLFLSARTVEWHLRKVYIKLHIKSRRELHTVLSRVRASPAAGEPSSLSPG
jgi:DNA-binding CsgD family transcriptional regulator